VLGLLLASPVLWFLAAPLYRLATRIDELPGGRTAESAGQDKDSAP
jgi:hypothetical protein